MPKVKINPIYSIRWQIVDDRSSYVSVKKGDPVLAISQRRNPSSDVPYLKPRLGVFQSTAFGLNMRPMLRLLEPNAPAYSERRLPVHQREICCPLNNIVDLYVGIDDIVVALTKLININGKEKRVIWPGLEPHAEWISTLPRPYDESLSTLLLYSHNEDAQNRLSQPAPYRLACRAVGYSRHPRKRLSP